MSLSIEIKDVAFDDVPALLQALQQAAAYTVPLAREAEPLAEWEKDLLAQPITPRVATWHGDFRVGQLVALRSEHCEAVAEVVTVKPHIELRGRYLEGDSMMDAAMSGPAADEIDDGAWLILREPQA